MARMRTIDQVADWLRKTDPDTALTKTALRRLVTTGQLPSVRIGQKYLLDLDTLTEYLKGTLPEAAPEAEYGKIRRVAG